MIIAINGKIGSGKDTVGSIIQYLMEHPISLDKTDHVNRSYNSFVMDIGMGSNPKWKIKKFAGKLKQIASLLTGVPEEKFEDQEFKKSDMPEEWNYCKQMFECDENNQDGFSVMPMTYREFLQKLGTEAIRNNLHFNTWVNALFADYVPRKVKTEDEEYEHILPNWIITDLRFPNGFIAVKNYKGFCIRVERTLKSHLEQPNSERALDKETILNAIAEFQRPATPLHPSETALDSYNFDYVLDNSGTIEDLVVEVEKMLKHFKLIL